MFLKALRLKDFRLFQDKVLKFSQVASLIIGPNASGKSSLVEAISLLSTGKSFRAARVEELIKFEQSLGQVKGLVAADFRNHDLADLDQLELGIMLTRGVVQGKRTKKTHYIVNQNKRQKKKFVGQLLSVVFKPEDMRLVEGSPSRRRDFLNTPLALVSYHYQHALKTYHQALRKRNKLLSLIKEGRQQPAVLKYWNMAIIKHGEKLHQKRQKFFEFVNAQVKPPLDFKVRYDASVLTKERLQQYQSRELAAGFTLIGPQKDDFKVLIRLAGQHRPVTSFGSRGQKRLAVLWLKRAELAFLKSKTGRQPILVLDDILSELDKRSRALVLDLVQGEQVIITTTDLALLAELELKFGQLQQIELV